MSEVCPVLMPSHPLDIANLPQVYFVPREGRFTRVTTYDRDHLRQLRTELELLKRVCRRAAVRHVPDLCSTAAHYTQADREELARIIRDARHPAVEETAALLDEEFSTVRKDIVMSAVNDEAENIVQEAIEAGVLETVLPADGPATEQDAFGEPTCEVQSPAPEADTDVTATAGMLAQSKTDLSAALKQAEQALDEATQLCREGLGENVLDQPFEEPSGHGPEAGTQPEQVAADQSDAAQADDAKQVLEPVTESGATVSEAKGQVETLLDEIRRLRDGARAVVEELGKTRDEARLLREDARRARERADAAAVAAEQAAREARHAAQPAGTE